MQPVKALSSLRLLTYIVIVCGSLGCEHDSYTTWNCKSNEQTKQSMVLRKAQMEFQGSKLNFCGSLGIQSYFDENCQTQTSQSSTTFTPSSGVLMFKGQEFQCAVL